MSTIFDQLETIVGAEYVFRAPGELEPYARDATPLFHALPQAVVLPGSTKEIAEILRWASTNGVPVVPRGAGSSLSAGTIPVRGGIVLATTRMNQIIEVAADEMLARAQAGVTTAALAEAVAGHGLCYPPDPGSFRVSTIAGNVATCAGGLRGLKYGVTRNYILGLEVVLATGEIIRTGGRLWKDVAGYDLTRLLTGSEGTLAVITEVTVALLPAPATARTGVAYFPTLADAGNAVSGVLAAGIVPATLEFLDRRCVNAVEDHAGLGLDRTAGALLLFGDDGQPDIVERNLASIERVCLDQGASATTVSSDVAAADALLEARRCSLPALARLAPITILEDVSVPRPRIAELVSRIEEIADRHRVIIATFGHAGDGNLHPTACVDPADGDAADRAHAAFGEIFRVATSLGGTITGEHGVGAAKLGYLADHLGPEQMELLRRVKTAFDPAGILNPGKLGS